MDTPLLSSVSAPLRLSSDQARDRAARRPTIALVSGSALGLLVAGFWNVNAMDGLGVALFVNPLVGEFRGLGTAFAEGGGAFGALFAVAAGLAATCTASGWTSLTMIPALMRDDGTPGHEPASWSAVGTLLACAALVGALYGVFAGRLGPEGVTAFNVGPIRGAQSLVVYSALGGLMLVAAFFEAGYGSRLSPTAWAFWSRPLARAALAGLVIGGFSLGRPLAVFREFLVYAAQPALVGYGAVVMALQTLCTCAVTVLVWLAAGAIMRRRSLAWSRQARESRAALAAAALACGGTFLVFYWCISRLWPALGRWGFALGIYG